MSDVRTAPGFENETAVMYFSGRQFFDEAIFEGNLVTRLRNGIGLVSPISHFYSEVYSLVDSRAFRLSVDGEKLNGGWANLGFEDFRDGHSVRYLEHPATGIKVGVHTQLYGGDFVKRWLDIENTADHTVAITELAPYAGLIFRHSNRDQYLIQKTPFRIAYNHTNEQMYEGDFYFDDLDRDFKFTANRGRSFARPGFWIRDEITAETFVYEYAFSGNWELNVEISDTKANEYALGFAVSMYAPDGEAIRVLKTGEKVTTPAGFFAMFKCSDDEIVQSSHRFVREHLRPKLPESSPRIEIEANHRGYFGDNGTAETIKNDVDVDSENGIEMYVIDAGWYGSVKSPSWFEGVGDWVDGEWMGKGVADIADYVHSKKMRFGLWVELEACGVNAPLYRSHPEWRMERCERALDLAIPEVEQYLTDTLIGIVKKNKLDMYRLDHNHEYGAGGRRLVDGIVENTNWRYFEAFERIFRTLRRTFPQLMMQGCAAGGGRLDWGIIQLFDNFQVSDCNRSPRSTRIFNGLTMSLPPETLMKPLGMDVGDLLIDGDLDAQLREGILCTPLLVGIAPSKYLVSEVLKKSLRANFAILKNFITPILEDEHSLIYHHTPFQKTIGDDPKMILEYADRNTKKAVIAVFATGTKAVGDAVIIPR